MEINDILKTSFEKYLKTLGYAESTIYSSVYYVKGFFFYLKTQQIESLEQIQPATITGYYSYLQTRPLKKQTGCLSQNAIAINISALRRFSKYLMETGRPCFEVTVKPKQNKDTIKTILSKAEIKELYNACQSWKDEPFVYYSKENAEILAARNRAILSIFYGCGLRRSEGHALDVQDILLKEKLVFVRKGKNYKERYVPMAASVKEDLENYICNAREKILSYKGTSENALFLNLQATRLSKNAIAERVKKLVQCANIQKDIGLHTLRHSIATHLLQSGLSLEEVSKFLGHSSLESTQIYTHIAND